MRLLYSGNLIVSSIVTGFLSLCFVKIICFPTLMAYIHDHDGFFICPLPMYASYSKAFNNALDQHSFEFLLPYKENINRGFEVPLVIDHNGQRCRETDYLNETHREKTSNY